MLLAQLLAFIAMTSEVTASGGNPSSGPGEVDDASGVTGGKLSAASVASRPANYDGQPRPHSGPARLNQRDEKSEFADWAWRVFSPPKDGDWMVARADMEQKIWCPHWHQTAQFKGVSYKSYVFNCQAIFWYRFDYPAGKYLHIATGNYNWDNSGVVWFWEA